MSEEPVLRQGFFHQREVHAVGGLHMIKGNGKPHFSLVMKSWQHMPSGRKVEDTFGAAHEELVRYWPELAPLAALHLSDIDGVPMHAEANGWYWLAGTVGGLGERFHGGNSFPARSPAECQDVLAKHLRLSNEEAGSLVAAIASKAHEVSLASARRQFRRWIDEQKPRWQGEARACIEQLGPQVFGGPYDRPVSAG